MTTGAYLDDWNAPYAPAPWDDQPEPEAVLAPLERLRGALVTSEGLDSIPEPAPLIADVLFMDSTAWLIGKPGHAKSFLAIDFAGCVATGEPWKGRKVAAGVVLYIAAEGVSGVRQRVRAWEQAEGRPMTGVLWLPEPVQADSAGWDVLVELVREIRPVLIVLDTQARITVGLEENSAKDMGTFVDKIERLRRSAGSCVLVVHHQGRSGEHGRGSTAIDGAATTTIRVEKDDDAVRVFCPKQKDTEAFDEILLRLVPMGESAILADDLDGLVGSIGKRTAALKMARTWWDLHGDDWCSASKLISSEVAASTTLFRNVKDLMNSGAAEKDKSGPYAKYRLLRDPG